MFKIQIITKFGVLEAQAKSSVAECIRRVKADDPIWRSYPIRVIPGKQWKKKYFRRGLAIRLCLK